MIVYIFLPLVYLIHQVQKYIYQLQIHIRSFLLNNFFLKKGRKLYNIPKFGHPFLK